MQKPNAGTSSTQQPSKKVDADLDNKKPVQKPNERISKDDDFKSPQRSK